MSASVGFAEPPNLPPTLSVEQAGRLLGLGRSTAYVEARRYLATDGREGLPALRFGRVVRCPTRQIMRLLGYDETALPVPAPD